MRCVVCGRAPSEGCNDKTHAAHDRMWLDLPFPPVVVDVVALKRRRLELAWSLSYVGRRLGVHRNSIRSWEMGTTPTIRQQLAWQEVVTKGT